MKAVVAVDSVFGNTKLIAEAMREEFERAGNEVEFINLRKEFRVPTSGDILLVGSPTRIAKMTRRSKRFVKKLDVSAWGDKPVVVFDTHMPLSKDPKEREKGLKWVEPGAAGRLGDLASSRGLKVRSPYLRFKVADMKGPLAPGELERARESIQQLIPTIGSE